MQFSIYLIVFPKTNLQGEDFLSWAISDIVPGDALILVTNKNNLTTIAVVL